MNVAIFSDTHGNRVALDAVLDDLTRREIDAMVCLGDALQGGSQPREVFERLREIGCTTVLGNSDAFVLSGEVGADSTEAVTEAQRQVREWTFEQLGDDGLDFIRAMPMTASVTLDDGGELLCFHGSPRSYDEVLLPEWDDEKFAPAFSGTSAAILAGGHTHLQWVRHFGGRSFFNPGSAGVAYNRYADPVTFRFLPLAQYAVVHSTQERAHIEFCQVPFDIDALDRAARASGRPFAKGEAARYR